MSTSPITPRLVSIIIPAYNAAATLAETVESCLAQTYNNVEIIVVNDGSNDRTAEVLQSFGKAITLVHKSNGGLASARNAGARVAVGEYMAWMDADDLMSPDRIMLQVGVLTSVPAIELVSSDFSAFKNVDADFTASYIGSYYSAANRLGGLANIYPQICDATASGCCVPVRTGQVYLSLLSGNFVHPPTVMVRRRLCELVGDFDESLRFSSDYDFILRAARIGRFAYIDTPLLRYRVSDTQMSHSGAAGKIPLETVEILEKVQRDDPDISQSQKDLFRRRYAESLTNAADMIGPSDRVRAFSLLIRGLRHKLLFSAALHAFARIVAPRSVVRTIKRVWRGLARAFT